MKNCRFSTNISLYFENGTRYDTALVTLEDGLCDSWASCRVRGQTDRRTDGWIV